VSLGDNRRDAAFDALMGNLDPPMVVVTTAHAGERSGCLVGFHSQCGIMPRRYALWISRANHTTELAAEARTFAVHALRVDQHALAELFGARTGDDIDKFARWGWTAGPDGVPLLDDCPDRLIGQRHSLVEVDADHLCLVIEPTSIGRGTPTPWLRLHDVADLHAGHAPDDLRPPG
jgi:flavin reductase (DIM6/NTAB) family NADH-FMN oxidoreductase RutF